MKIKTLDYKEFNAFSLKYKNSNYYQTSYYGDVMKKSGFDVDYLGFYNNNNDLIGASLILSKKIFMNYKFAYAPNGFLIDYTDEDIITDLTSKLKKLFLKQNYLFFKIDPLIKCSERDRNGEIISTSRDTKGIIEILEKNGYIHNGFNKYFENLKPRWNAMTRLTVSNDKLYYEISKQARNKINKANKRGVEVIEGTKEDLDTFYNFIKHKHTRSLSYYRDLFECYPDGDISIYLARINPEKFVRNSQHIYEKESDRNNQLYHDIQSKPIGSNDREKLISKKMNSDKVLGIAESDLMYSTRLFQSNSDGIVIGGIVTIKFRDTVYFIMEGFDNNYTSFNPNYLLKWELMKKFNEEEFKMINLNAVSGDFTLKNKYKGLNEMKLGFNASIFEYIGEFDYIVNKPIFKMYNIQLMNKTTLEIKDRYR